MKSFFKNRKRGLPSEAQKALRPRKESIERGRARFLAAFDASPMARNAAAAPVRSGYVALFFKIAVGAVALFCVATGVSVYADTANVSATNPLYPLKRASEDVRLALSLPAQKPVIQASLAVRRADEISALESSDPKSKLIPQLTGDLDADIQGSLDATIEAHGNGNGNGHGNSNDNGDDHGHDHNHENGNGSEGYAISQGTSTTSTENDATSSKSDNDNSNDDDNTLDVYCHAFNTATTGVLMARLEHQLSLDPAAWAEFNARCVSGFDGGNASSSASSTVTVSAAATTTARGQGQEHGHGWAQGAASVRGILQLP